MFYWKIVVFCFLSSIGSLSFPWEQAISAAAPTASAESSTPEAYMARGLTSFERGNFEQAIVNWTDAARLFGDSGKPKEQTEALIQLAQAYQAVGQYTEALKRLDAAQKISEQSGDRTQLALVLGDLGNAYIASGSPDVAEKYLRQALATARELKNSGLTAIILNNLGNLLASQEQYAAAIGAYTESVTLAERDRNRALAASALTNAARASMQNGQYKESKALLDRALDQLRTVDYSRDKAFTLMNAALTYRELRQSMPEMGDALLLLAFNSLNEAAGVAENNGDRRTVSYAWGYLGQLYEDERRYDDALQLTRRAISTAQQVNAPESLYRWQWQAGRLLKKRGLADEAMAAYRRAVDALQSIRLEILTSYGSPQTFRESVGTLYFELVDLLLQKATSLRNKDEVGPYLIEARETVELFKVAELRDYFRDDCIDMALAKGTQLDTLVQTAVVVYPILLPERLELLVSLPSGLKRFTVAVAADTATQEVRLFRRYLEKRTTRQYLPHAQKLYDWLIRPLEAELAPLRIETLVFVPDGPLRTIPMAALHDGKEFLINKYALAITPGLSLTDPQPIRRKQMNVLAAGVTESVQGFPALPNVSTELMALQTLFPGKTLVNKEFLVRNLEKQLKDEQFTIVHIASHAQFGSTLDNTFLLSFDDKLTMDRLDQYVGAFRFRDDPLELLTLSACETAAGDDRAALGLAGIAIKAGARSAVATLWNINDLASSELIVEFYRQLKDPSISRATALQRAQLTLLNNARYEHPGFWSPYLLINTWL